MYDWHTKKDVFTLIKALYWLYGASLNIWPMHGHGKSNKGINAIKLIRSISS